MGALVEFGQSERLDTCLPPRCIIDADIYPASMPRYLNYRMRAFDHFKLMAGSFLRVMQVVSIERASWNYYTVAQEDTPRFISQRTSIDSCGSLWLSVGEYLTSSEAAIAKFVRIAATAAAAGIAAVGAYLDAKFHIGGDLKLMIHFLRSQRDYEKAGSWLGYHRARDPPANKVAI
jgi:hypothetical protein